MRSMLIVASVVVLGAVSAFAMTNMMAGFYGNTVVVTGTSYKSHVHYRADHTFDVGGKLSGQTFNTKGTWNIDQKGQLCRKYDTAPPATPNPWCTPLTVAHVVGDTWSATGADGSARKVTLAAGVK